VFFNFLCVLCSYVITKTMTKVKICGITNLEDALLSAKFGADALGFNFYPNSPRCISPEKAAGIISEMPENILNVGVFVNEDSEKIAEIAELAGLDAIQLHGDETPEFVRELKEKTGLEIIKAFRVDEDFRPEDVLEYETDAILLDAFSKNDFGGTGKTFDWKFALQVNDIHPKVFLAGGLTHENVFRATKNYYCLDTCSGVESNKGQKDRIKLINFISIVKNQNKYKQVSKENRKPHNMFEFLSHIQARPAIYLGTKSLTKLQAFLSGFSVAFYYADTELENGLYESEDYRKWMSEKVGYHYPNSFSCITYILKQNNGDEEISFDHFFALIEEFKLDHGI
jgi:phosphoribosylanthranilate isomerase